MEADQAAFRIVGIRGWLNEVDLCRLERVGRGGYVDDQGWASVVSQLWACSSRGHFATWFQCLYYLETSAKKIALEQNLAAALRAMKTRGIVGEDIGMMCYALLHRHSEPQLRRCVASYATEDIIPRSHQQKQRIAQVKSLCRFLANELRQASDVEDALRRVLDIFPFLPAFSSHGADRVIDELARVYAMIRAEKGILCNTYKEKDSPLEALFDQDIDIAATSYLIWYAIIMLNTDLHNPRIQSKITEDGFVRSLGTAAAVDTEPVARALYRSIRLRPLLADKRALLWSTRNKHRPSSASRARRLFQTMYTRNSYLDYVNLTGLYLFAFGLLLLLFRLVFLFFLSSTTLEGAFHLTALIKLIFSVSF